MSESELTKSCFVLDGSSVRAQVRFEVDRDVLQPGPTLRARNDRRPDQGGGHNLYGDHGPGMLRDILFLWGPFINDVTQT